MKPLDPVVVEWILADAGDDAITALQLWETYNRPDTQRKLMKNSDALWVMARDLADHLAGAMGISNSVTFRDSQLPGGQKKKK